MHLERTDSLPCLNSTHVHLRYLLWLITSFGRNTVILMPAGKVHTHRLARDTISLGLKPIHESLKRLLSGRHAMRLYESQAMADMPSAYLTAAAANAYQDPSVLRTVARDLMLLGDSSAARFRWGE